MMPAPQLGQNWGEAHGGASAHAMQEQAIYPQQDSFSHLPLAQI
jgi:hypothetical protein